MILNHLQSSHKKFTLIFETTDALNTLSMYTYRKPSHKDTLLKNCHDF